MIVLSTPRDMGMKLNNHADTDSLYIDLSERPSVESREITEGVVLDYDAEGNLVGIDIDDASRNGGPEESHIKSAARDHSYKPSVSKAREAPLLRYAVRCERKRNAPSTINRFVTRITVKAMAGTKCMPGSFAATWIASTALTRPRGNSHRMISRSAGANLRNAQLLL